MSYRKRNTSNPSYPSAPTRNLLAGALGVPRFAMNRGGGIDPILYAFAGLPFGGSAVPNGNGGWSYQMPNAGGGTTTPPGGGTTNPPAGGGTTTPPPTPWQYPQMMQSPLPFSLGPDWRRTMLYAGMFPSNNNQ